MALLDTSQKTITVLTATFALISGVSTWYTGNKVEQNKQAIEQSRQELQDQLQRQQIDLQSTESDRKLNFQLYETVASAIETNNPQKQQAARALVIALADDDNYCNALLNCFSVSNNVNDKEKAEIERDKGSLIINNTPPSSPIDKRIDIDIFYLEGNEQLKLTANNLAQRIDSGKYHVRVRLLTAAINSRSGYQIAENQFRVDSEKEKTIASQLNSTLSIGYTINQIGKKPTPYYISIFIVH